MITRLKQPGILNWPNLITMGRLVAVPILLIVMLFLKPEPSTMKSNAFISLFSAVLFAAAMLSDMLDGYLARRYKIMSNFGSFLDPLADKLLFLTGMVMFIEVHRLPAWLVVLFLLREVTVTGLRSVAIDKGVVIAASKWGKYKSACISASMISLLLYYPFFGIAWKHIGWFFLWPALALSLISGFDYCWGFYAGMKSQSKS
ncbi:MAG: CDP-diacylglycerol--glycerol-3-phosphate 3-phosphatidyltransferase [Deltaproteobacteria bacterium CG_4_10_14_0_2_um_filter_43_8]|nr:MAG: CDP-diacylglycerol--glycerol-3-phosphate 3-phosphatidyltransferase [Deltaproteobacteria bacterium CG11_big_fil_rev_8_21_14_0_20_42_23]PJA19449.1 MAG: CDP-diacylglycerol--glycerol-3-phosphate 3-phosphatidyltransferase [Deltaproteobacteria bacterium CG_4_10_14_0_2_um_filter_43_8]PJC63765.1 MAG: CDP-diacylglycerol--glycerol-3-phosphate 3-phosphatidyltransferase [Deltaproteobacteria bacterium CG_4_9_14_0_2_um_filter_42_21]